MSLATRRVLREAVASAIVTLVVTAAFSGYASRSGSPVTMIVARAPMPATIVVDAAPPSQDVLKTWFDPSYVVPTATGFRRPASEAAVARAHRRVMIKQFAPRAPLRLGGGAAAHPSVATEHRPAVAMAASAAGADDDRFRVFGVAPGDLVPSPSGLMRHVKTMGSSIAGLADWL